MINSMKREIEIHINAVAFRGDDGEWVVQGIEHDISAFTYDVMDIPDVFERAVMEYVCITQSLNRAPLAGIKAAPARFKRMFETAKRKLVDTDKPDRDIRLVQAA